MSRQKTKYYQTTDT